MIQKSEYQLGPLMDLRTDSYGPDGGFEVDRSLGERQRGKKMIEEDVWIAGKY